MTNKRHLVNTLQSALSGICLLLMVHTANAQTMQDHYRIFSVKENKEVTLDAIVNDMANYDVAFYGEEHNDSVAHYLQHTLLEQLFAKYNSQMVLSLEMFERDVQPVMNEYLAGAIREKNFLKDARVWNNYNDYKPMVEFAKAHNLPVICANAAGRYSNLAGRKGQQALADLPKQSKHYFAPIPYQIATGKYLEKLEGVMGHSPAPAPTDNKKAAPAMPSMGGFNFITSQSLWDATMAYSIAEFLKKHKGKKVLQVNGRFHSDEGFAAVTQLKKYRPRAKSLVISSGSDEAFPNIDWKQYTSLGDYVIITDPRVAKTF